MTYRILFVCLGNICRSPSAEGAVRARLGERPVTLDSAGTGNWHVGKPPYGPMQSAALKRGLDLSDLRARQVQQADFHAFDLIVAMDGENLSDLRALAPKGARAKLALFTDFAPHTTAKDVPDPYYTRDFDGALDLIETCAEGLVAQL